MRALLRMASVVVCGAALAALISGCEQQTDVGAELRESIARLGEVSEIESLADLRTLGEPSRELREHFLSSGDVYRVIESSRERALLAFWRIDAPRPMGMFDGDPGFSTEDHLVASACASVERKRDAVVSEPVNCPHPLADWQPSADAPRWTRDASALWAVQLGVFALEADLRWLVFHDKDGTQPRSEPIDVAAVVEVIDAAELSATGAEVTAAIVNVAQSGDHITGRVRLTATAPEDANVNESATSTACFNLDVDLAFARQAGTWQSLASADC